MFDLFVEEIDYYLSLDPEFSGQSEMINEFFGAYRAIFSLYQSCQVYDTSEEFKANLDVRFHEKTCEICTGLTNIEKSGPVARQRIQDTFTSFFARIGWDCSRDCMMQSPGAGQPAMEIPGM